MTRDPNRLIPRAELIAELRASRPLTAPLPDDPFDRGLRTGHFNRWLIMVAGIAALLGEDTRDLEAECGHVRKRF